jgi:protocatechuate 3,4-dioxygenase beta subunit
MSRLFPAITAAGLALASSWSVAAQVRDRPGPLTAQLGTIAGRVEIEIDGQRVPVRRARVTLATDTGGKQSITATDTDGRYRFERIASGTYRVRAEKPGFVSRSPDPEGPGDTPAPIQVTASGTVAVDVAMQRGGALEGQFLDDHGKPIARLAVSADRLVGPAERPAVADTRSTTTDDLGRFRVHTLWPGRYRLRATPPPPASGREVYYTDGQGSGAATVLTLPAGQTLDHLDFRVATAPLSPIAANALAAREKETASVATANVPGARVSGRVTRSETGEPIASAAVQMRPERTNTARTARTNSGGQFEFTGVSAGSYVLTATADGYVSLDGSIIRPAGAGVPIDVKEQERIEKADLTLAPAGAIEGRVLDEFGDAAPGVTVQVTQLASGVGPSVFAPGSANPEMVPTDDRGWFRRSGLPPGEYYLLAPSPPLTNLNGGQAASLEAAVDADATTGFATTFYPGTDSPAAATPVRVAAGVDARDVTFGLVGARMVRISGVAVALAPAPVTPEGLKTRMVMVLIQTYGGDVRTMVGHMTSADEHGFFRFPAVPEGTYVLQGSVSGLFGSMPVTATATPPGTSLEVALTMRPRTMARGRLLFEGDGAPPRDPASVRIYVLQTDLGSGRFGGGAIESRITQQWDFEIGNLAWSGVIRALTPPEWRLQSVRLAGRDITDTPYDFQSADVNGLEVVLTSRLGAVVGAVMDAGRPAANSTVVVFGPDDTASVVPSRFIASARPNAQGAFSIRGLLPGRYHAVAVPQSTIPLMGRVGLATLRPFATPIEVSEGLDTQLTLTMVKR